MDRPRILLLDRPSPSLRSLASALDAQGFAVPPTDEPGLALAAIRPGECAVLLGEIHLAAEAVLDEMRDEVRGPGAVPPLIVFDDFAGSPGPGAALRASVFDALARPVSEEEVLRSVRRALERSEEHTS